MSMSDVAPNAINKSAARIIISKIVSAIFVTIALGLVVYGGLQLLHRRKATTGVAPPPNAQVVVTEDVAEPSETKPQESAYTVPADQPRSISLPTINASGLIQKVGVTKENAVSTPNNINFAGWFTDSVKPGDAGLSIIDGHVSGKFSDGIFKKLSNLKPNDTFTVEYGDKSTRSFSVVEVKTMPEEESAAVLFAKKTDIGKQLNLITCGGVFNKTTQKYEDRTVVIATAK